MPVPAVSHETWEKTRVMCQIALGTLEIDASNLSFDRQVREIAEIEPEKLMDKIEGGLGDTEYTHANWTEPAYFSYNPHGDRTHRPEVSDETVEKLNEVIRKEHPQIPIEDVSFEDRLNVHLSSLEEYYPKVGVKIKRETSGE